MAIWGSTRWNFTYAHLVLGITLLFTITEIHCKRIIPLRRGPVGEAIFDITKFGAKGNGIEDDTMAIMEGWQAACKSAAPARLVFPRKGQFVASEIVFQGPCTSHMTLDIQGTLLAYSDPSSYTGSAWIQIERVNGILITGGGTINGRGQEVWQYARGSDGSGALLPTSLVLQTVQNAQMNFLNFIDSMGFHTKVTDSNDITINNLRITAPADSPNTDGMHLSSSINVNITDSVIGTGDDCISVGHGTENILIARITCGPGHGLSVGSLGKRPNETNLRRITIINCTLIGTTNGARIKTYHDSPKILATGIYFQDLLMQRVKNPIVIDQHYNSKKTPKQSSVKLSDVHFRNIWGTTISPVPINLNCSSSFPCDKVELSNINLAPFGRVGPLTSTCSNAKFFVGGKVYPRAPAC
ncbi:hypothetical protein ACS0TY_012755 [Phlomoides rotata]